jgi:hypothetical protein
MSRTFGTPAVEFRVFKCAYKGDLRVATSALNETIYQDTPGNSQGLEYGFDEFGHVNAVWGWRVFRPIVLGPIAPAYRRRNHPDFARAATTLSEAGATGRASCPPTPLRRPILPQASAKAYALLNQMMARDFGRESHFAQAATELSASSQQQANLLTRPLH